MEDKTTTPKSRHRNPVPNEKSTTSDGSLKGVGTWNDEEILTLDPAKGALGPSPAVLRRRDHRAYIVADPNEFEVLKVAFLLPDNDLRRELIIVLLGRMTLEGGDPNRWLTEAAEQVRANAGIQWEFVLRKDTARGATTHYFEVMRYK